MPTLDTKLSRISRLLGKDISISELEELLFIYGMELDTVEKVEDDYNLKIEITPDRPDMLSTYGLVRALRRYMGLDKNPSEYIAKKSSFLIQVDSSVSSIRPYIAAAVFKNLNISEDDLEELIYAQEKLHATFCRDRKKASIGLYPFDKIKWPLRYYATEPENIEFVPLEFGYMMNANEILKVHPTGQKYAYLLEGFKKYPVFVDASGNVLSFPPIINSEDYGKVQPGEKNVMLEVTGTHKPTVELVVNIFSSILADMGGEMYEVEIRYPNGITEKSPYLKPKEWKIDRSYISKNLGIILNDASLKKLLSKMDYKIKSITEKELIVSVQPYRADIMHQIDIVDDIARAYGFDNFDPELTPIFTIGHELKRTEIIDSIREILVGAGFNEVFTFALTSMEEQFDLMLLPTKEVVLIEGAKERKLNMVRYWLIPELLKTLSYNKGKKYPIRIFEVSDVVVLDEKVDTRARNETHISAMIASTETDFTEIRRFLEYLLHALGFRNIRVERAKHPSFIEGRFGNILVNEKLVGLLGEIHPQVILNWMMNVPISAFEINLDSLFDLEYHEVEIN